MSAAVLPDEVKNIFTAYLEKQKQRKTPERFAILDEVYSIAGHFDVETLHARMKDRNYQVSLATVYNTLELLMDAGLVIRHQFKKNLALFEKSYGYRQHDHLICSHCDKVLEFCDPRIQQIQSMMGDLLGFSIREHSLHLHGEPVINDDGTCRHCGKMVADVEN